MTIKRTKNSFRVLVLPFLAGACSFLFVFNNTFAEEIAHKTILENGMVILVQEVPASPVVALQALVKTGSANEGQYLGSGISHFVEHMLFKGTQKRGIGQISRDAKALGGIINASTSFDYTMYTLEVPKDSFSKALDILADMIMNSRFDPAEVEKEREVVLGEIRLYRDNPDRYISQLIFSNVYTRHPYRHPIIGYEPLFKDISRDHLFDYYKSHYIPNNIVLSVAGSVGSAKALKEITEIFAEFKPQPYQMRHLPVEPEQLSTRRYSEEYSTELARVSIVYQGIGLAHHDLFALDVLAMILGHGESSRLYPIRKKGLVYSISASNFTPLDTGAFEISGTLEEAKINEAETAIREEIEKIKKGGVKEQELEKAKRAVLSRYLNGRQTSGDIAYDNAANEAFLGDLDFSKTYVKSAKMLTVGEIKKAANRYLNDATMTVVALRPKNKIQEATQEKSLPSPPEIQKIVLDNGMIILLREDRAHPLVSIRLTLAGGLRREDDTTNGISNLTADLWVKGTKSKTSQQIANTTEARAISLGGFSGQNSIGITCDLLSEDLEFTLDLLEDLVKNPIFPEDELRKDKDEAKSAIRARNDNIFSFTGLTLKQTLFLNHPYRRDPLGTLESIGHITREGVIDFYRKLCVPNNMVLSIYGDFQPEKILPLIKAKFGRLQKKDLVLEKFSEQPPDQTREKTNFLDKTQAVVMIGFQAATMYDQDRYVFEVVASLLGSSLNGRIFTKIRDELGQAYTLGGSYTPGIDTGIANFYVSTTPDQVDKVKDILLSQIEALQADDVTGQELEDTKTYLKGTFDMRLETNASLAFMTALDELYGLGYDQYQRYAAAIDRVTKEDIRRLAKTYLTKDKAAIVITRPQPATRENEPRPAASQ